MGFKFGFRKTLLKIGKWRFGIGYSTHGIAGMVMLCIYGLLNLMWYTMIAMFWIIYGCCWLMYKGFVLCVMLPIKKLVSLFKNKDSIEQ